MASLKRGRTGRPAISSLIVSLALLLFSNAQATTDITGAWKGAINLPGMELEVSVNFDSTETGWSGTIDIPMQNARDLPLSGITADAENVEFAIAGVPGEPTFSGTLSEDGKSIAGDFIQAGQNFTFELTREDEASRAAAAESLQEKLNLVRAFVDSTMQFWKVPAVGMAIVKDGEVVLSEGFGYRSLKDSLPATSRTLFAIGSSTKAFTTTAMGILVDEGLLEWDQPVRAYLHDFELHDDYASTHMTPRDLVTHRSGLPRHDLVWYNSDLSRPQLYERLRYLEPSEDFRTTFQYQNLMFMTAGYLVGQRSGGTWEDFVATRIFKPLGMDNSNFSVLESQQSPDYALPYEKTEEDDEEIVEEIPFRNITSMGPAGSINSCADDMARWLLLQIGAGQVNEAQIISAANLKQLHTPQIVLGSSSPYTESLLSSYGMGWFIKAYRGHLYIDHGGNIDGFSAEVAFLPNENIGVAVLANLNATGLPNLITYYVADLFLELDPVEWHARAQLRREQAEAAMDEEKSETMDHVEGTKPSHELKAYVGDYENSGYGIISVRLEDKQLKATYNSIDLPLEHWHYDLFKAEAGDIPGEPEMMLTFLTNLKGDIDRIRMPLEVSVAEVEFTRRPPAEMLDPEFLERFVGVYELVGQEVNITLRGEKTLVATVAGQPAYALVPYKGYDFLFKDLNGFSVEFLIDDSGNVTGADFKQPNGVFSAVKKPE